MSSPGQRHKQRVHAVQGAQQAASSGVATGAVADSLHLQLIALEQDMVRLRKLARIGESRLDPFPYPGPPPGMQVATGDVVTDADGAPMAAGYMTITQGSFPWTLNYDEVQIVFEGELHLGGDAGGKIGRPGDILYVPKGSRITFGTPTWAKFVYVTFPANWEDA